MSSFDLADALEGLAVEEKVTKTSSCNTVQDVKTDTFRLEDGLDLLVYKNFKTLRSSATVLLAVNRMKKSLSHKVKTLRGHELFSVLVGNLVEETIVKTTVDWSTKAKIFQRANSETECTMSDVSQQSLVFEPQQMKLLALRLIGGYEEHKGCFTLSRYETSTSSGGQAVLLSISKYYLSCSMNKDKAELNLELCSQEDLGRISDDTNMLRFLFWKKMEGTELVRFESISCPGWFIGTPAESGKPVEMCVADSQRYTCFRAAQ